MSKHAKSAELFRRALKVTPGGVHSPVRAFRSVGGTPVFTERANGSRLTDVDGNSYLDFCMSWGPLLLGHNDPDIAAAVRTATNNGCSFGTSEAGSLQLAELITGNIPWVEKIRFVNSGTEAVMSAIRLARGATGRNKLLKFAGCYHGHVDALLVQAGSGMAGAADSAGVTAATAAETLVAPLDDIAALESIFARHGGEIAALIIEPVPANWGLLRQRDGYLERIAAIARAAGSLVIFDEVITGFRLSFGGGAEYFGVQPDLVTYGKIIGGGLPVGAYGGKAELMELVAPNGPVYQAGTLSANPLAMAAGNAALGKLLQANPYAELATKTQRLCESLQGLAPAGGGIALHAFNSGSLFWLMLGDARDETAQPRKPDDIPGIHAALYPALFHRLLDSGVYLAPSPFEVGFLSTAHSASDLDSFAACVTGALDGLGDPAAGSAF